MKKRFFCCLAALLMLLCAVPGRSYALETSATAAYLVDVTTGRVLFEKNPDKQMLIASTTKIMTALVAVRYGTLTDTVTVSKNAANTEGSSMYLKAGEKLTLHTLLYGLLMRSGNDAAVAIAEHISGSTTRFAARMNEMAKELGMTNSSFANPHGLNQKGHYSTARDMAKLAAAAMENETIRRITSTRSITIGSRTMQNQNKLLGLVEGCIGLKTGWTRAAGRTLVSCVERDGHRVVAVTLQDGNDWVDHQTFYEYAFNLFRQEAAEAAQSAAQGTGEAARAEAGGGPKVMLTAEGEYFGQLSVEGGRWASVALRTTDAVYADVPNGARVSVRPNLISRVIAPVEAGTEVGQAVYLVNGHEIGRTAVVCADSVPAAENAALASLRSSLPG